MTMIAPRATGLSGPAGNELICDNGKPKNIKTKKAKNPKKHMNLQHKQEWPFHRF